MAAIVGLVLVALVVIAIFKGVRVVPQGCEWTVETFGKYTAHAGAAACICLCRSTRRSGARST